MSNGFRPVVLWGIFVLITLLAVSCSPRPARTVVGAAPAAPEVETELVGEEIGDEITGEEIETSAEGTGTGGQQPVSDTGVAADIPIPEEAYQVQIARQGRTVIFQIDGKIEDIVTYYQENLPGLGWDLAGPPDTYMGSIASMLRENEAGDKLTINMQGNELGGFVRVTLTVIRGG